MAINTEYNFYQTQGQNNGQLNRRYLPKNRITLGGDQRLKEGRKMKKVCYVCKILYGIKEPLHDNSETHGICPECLELEIKKLENFKFLNSTPRGRGLIKSLKET